MKKTAKMEERSVIIKNSGVPFYYQLKHYIIKKIKTDKWKPDQKIMPEMDICKKLNISRTVVRQATSELINEGYLIRKKTRGTFVAEPKIEERLVQKLIGTHEDLYTLGFKIENDILAQDLIKPTKEIANYLKIDNKEKVIKLYRLRKLNGKPLIIVTTYIPYKLCPDLLKEDMKDKSLYKFLKEHGIEIEKGERFIEAVPASRDESNLLRVKNNSPLILIESISYLKNGLPIEYFKSLHRGDKCRFSVILKREKYYKKSTLIPYLNIKK